MTNASASLVTRILLAASVLVLAAAPLATQESLAEVSHGLTIDPSWVSGFHWRSVGPAAAGGRILRVLPDPEAKQRVRF